MISQNTIAFNGRTPKPRSAFVGMIGEHNAHTVYLEGLPEITDGVYTVNLVLPDGTAGDVLDIEDGAFEITRTYSQQAGQIQCWVSIQVGTEMVWKSDLFYLIVEDLPEIDEVIKKTYPSAIEKALDKIENMELYISETGHLILEV